MSGEEQELPESPEIGGSGRTLDPKANDANNSHVITQNKEEPRPSSASQSVPYYRLYSYADRLDIILIVLGCIGAIIHGLALPIFFVVFGDVVDALGTDKTSLIPEVSSLSHTESSQGFRMTCVREHCIMMCHSIWDIPEARQALQPVISQKVPNQVLMVYGLQFIVFLAELPAFLPCATPVHSC